MLVELSEQEICLLCEAVGTLLDNGPIGDAALRGNRSWQVRGRALLTRLGQRLLELADEAEHDEGGA